VNYVDVCAETKKFEAARRDKLSETLADALATAEFASGIRELKPSEASGLTILSLQFEWGGLKPASYEVPICDLEI
jgi:hypothetical protein